MTNADTAAQYEILATYPADWLRAERDDLIASIARGLEARRSAEPSDWNLSAAEVDAMVMIQAEVARLGVKGPAGHVLAARFVSEGLAG